MAGAFGARVPPQQSARIHRGRQPVEEETSLLVSDEPTGPRARPVPDTELHSLMVRVATHRIPHRNRWITFEQVGSGPAAFVPRILLLWMIGLPLLAFRLIASTVLIFCSMSLPVMAISAGATTGAVVFQFVYRDVMTWAMEDNALQDMWDAIATVLAMIMRILVYTIRLAVEIHDGLCPIYAIFADILYTVMVELVGIWYAAPVLQNFALFLIQLVTCLLEPLLDLLVTVMESFVTLISLIPSGGDEDLVVSRRSQQASGAGMTVDAFEIYCSEHPTDPMCQAQTPSSSRRTLGADDALPMQDRLLEVCCVIFTVIVRLVQAFMYVFLPIIYGLLKRVLPVLLTLFPVAFEIVGSLATIVTSDATRRIFDGILHMLPLVFDVFGSILCGIVIYLGATVCYIIYGIAHLLSFVLQYMIRPCVCGCMAIYAGCFEAFVMSGIDGKSCYTCGQYNTACGCRKMTYPLGACDGNCMDHANPDEPTQVDVTPSPSLQDSVDSPSTYEGVGENSARDNKDAQVDRLVDDAVPPNSTLSASPVSIGVTAFVASTAQHMVVVASPGLYAALSIQEMTYPGGSTALLPVLGSLPRYSLTTDDTVCLHGAAEPECPVDETWLALRYTSDTKGVSAIMQSQAGTPWQPVDWRPASGGAVQSPWLRLDLKHPLVLTSLELIWNSNDVSLQAPISTKYELLRSGTAVYTTHGEYVCIIGMHSRHDTVDIPIDDRLVATSLKITLVSPCANANSADNLGALYSLRTVKAMALTVDTDEDHTFPRWAALSSPSVVGTSLNPTVQVWDSCKQGNLERLVDGRRGVSGGPVVFSKVATTQAPTLALDFRFTEDDHLHRLHRLVVHTRGPGSVAHHGLLVCPYNVTATTHTEVGAVPVDRSHCATSMPLTEAGGSSSQDFVSSRAAAYATATNGASVLALPSWWTAKNGFYTTAYYANMSKGELGRDASYTFEFTGPGAGSASYTPIAATGYRIWFAADGVDPFKSTRATNWQTVLLELGLDATHTQSAQWIRDPSVFGVCRADNTASTMSMQQQTQTHQNAFGATSAVRQWFAVDEFDAFTTAVVVTTSGPDGTTPASRRLLSARGERDERDERDDHAVAAQALQDRRFSWENKPARRTVADILDPLKSMHTPFKASSAAEHGRHQPFFDDLSQMPDPALEPVFGCEKYTLADGPRMRCFSKQRESIAFVPSSSSHTTDNHSVAPLSGQLMSERDARTLERHLESLSSLRSQQSVLRDIMITRLAKRQMRATNPTTPTPRQAPRHTSRQLLGSRIPGWDEMTSWVTDFVSDAISSLTGLICEAMSCSSYCSAANGCDRTNIGDCFEAFGRWMLEGIFGCSPGEDILDCIARPILDLLKLLLHKILWMIDQFGAFIGKLTGIGDMMQNVACIGCSLTNIAVGVLGEFIDNFPASMCMSIIDKGSQQCTEWGIGNEDFGANVFILMFPLMKSMFGLVQILPAFLEVWIEVAVVVFSDLIEFFPDFAGDMFDVFLWAVTASASVGSIEIIFEAFDPIVTGDTGGMQSKMRATTSQPVDAHPDLEITQERARAGDCTRTGEATNSGQKCGAAYSQSYADDQSVFGANGTNGTNGTKSTSVRGSIVGADVEIVTSDSSLTFALDANCGCGVQQPSCSSGADTGNCPYKEGTQIGKLRTQSAEVARMAADQSIVVYPNGSFPGNDCSHWPYCPGMEPRVVGAQLAADSGEFKDACVPSKRCKMQAVAPVQKDLDASKKLPFSCFSRGTDPNGSSVFWAKDTDCPSKLGIDELLAEKAVHRRRSDTATTARIQRRLARRLMGVEGLFEDKEDSDFWRAEEQRATNGTDGRPSEDGVPSAMERLTTASRGLNEMIKAGNRSYAQYQGAALYAEAHMLAVYAADGYTNLTNATTNMTHSVRFMQTIDYTNRIVGHSRQLLFGFSGADPVDIGCGWADAGAFSPNTYPCCRGLWCCIPPPFADDFVPQKDWFVWEDDWVALTQCPYTETYAQGWMFVMRAVCKSVRDAAGGTVGVWPYSGLVDAVWSVFMFPNDEWPDTTNGMLRCVAMNLGIYVVALLCVAALAYTWDDIESFYHAHGAIYVSSKSPPMKEYHSDHAKKTHGAYK